MSEDLISRSALIDVFRNWADRNAERGYDTAYDMVQECIEVVKERPIAYDVDKVVEQLYELGGVDGFDECAKAYDSAIEDAIKIVRTGGVE